MSEIVLHVQIPGLASMSVNTRSKNVRRCRDSRSHAGKHGIR